MRRILGEIDVAQDPMRDGEEPVPDCDGKERKRLLVALFARDTDSDPYLPSMEPDLTCSQKGMGRGEP